MPRHNDNATSSGGGKKRNQHHRGNHSAHKGKGLDRKLKAAKQILGQTSHKPEKKKRKTDRLEYDPA